MAKINTVYTKDGQTVSDLAVQFYGESKGKVEKILQANPHLSHYPALLPAGIKVIMPLIEIQAVSTQTTINLWD